ncbi:YciI family protein [Hoeflea prorocentri]|uniref:YciI family protein n=1 Tax=Hoeflea prorocentri TaxID=1922333 RepID=A0A9X3UGA9_9HYPH|nr:YciI family protein [Hoeflea prorocentri]MCY6380258.1 YciI family protein [Hoeflea prorocentri]MDA5398058.1 YciI family protein [Hoeflea prorocentri]
MQYAILIYGTEGFFERLPEEEQEIALQHHRDLQAELDEKGTLGPVARLMDTSSAMTVRKRGESVLVLDGPFAETKEQLLGLYIIECASIDEAIEQAKKLPAGVAAYEVRPVGWGGGTISDDTD